MSRLLYNIVLTLVIIAGAIRSFLRDMVETVRGWFWPSVPLEEPCLVTEYPGKVYAWSYMVTDNENGALFFDSSLGEWEKPLCQQLGDGAYRLELRFYRVEGGE